MVDTESVASPRSVLHHLDIGQRPTSQELRGAPLIPKCRVPARLRHCGSAFRESASAHRNRAGCRVMHQFDGRRMCEQGTWPIPPTPSRGGIPKDSDPWRDLSAQIPPVIRMSYSDCRFSQNLGSMPKYIPSRSAVSAVMGRWPPIRSLILLGETQGDGTDKSSRLQAY